MELSFENKIVLVTGAGSGIGRELVKTLIANNTKKVYAISRTKAHLDSLNEELRSNRLVTICVDLMDWNAVKSTLSHLEPIHCLVNNAAAALLSPFLDVTPKEFDTLFSVNVKAVINVSQIVAQNMIQHKIAGSIVNVSSQASKMGVHGHTVYSATKAALDSITQTMALELGKHQIRVNSVNPTVVMTDMGKLGWSDPKVAQPLLDRIPLHKFAEPEDVVNVILFLLSEKSGMVNAATVPIEGGVWST